MSTIIFADDTSRYDGRTMETRPLGGTESSVCYLTEALAARGHTIVACTNCDRPIEHKGVRWLPLAGPVPAVADAYFAVQHPRLFGLVARPRRRFVWLTWRPNNLKHHKNLFRVWWYRPSPVFTSEHQAEIYPRIVPQPRRKTVIPLGLPERVRGAAPLAEPPAPRAIFASNPVRDLTWLIDLWVRRIRPRVQGAELHVYGIRDYSYAFGTAWREPDWLRNAASGSDALGVVFHAPVPPDALAAAMRQSRVMLYGGHVSEMFCLAVAEAQALGVPAVLRPIAVMPERITDGVTGFLRADDEGFAAAAVQLLTDDALWRRQHEAALASRQGVSWDEVAALFERLLEQPG
jgi:glycosyltransferase involved in cell wall biosynthesis